jgi:ADP-heptose:LPS heptosyltransferase
MRLQPFKTLFRALMHLIKALDRRSTDIRHLNPEKIHSILVVSSTALGDTLMSTPAIHAIRERYPQARIIGHFYKANVELLSDNPDIDGIIPYHGGYRHFFSTIRALRREHFDLALIFHGNEPQATPMAYLSGARFILKLPNTSDFGFLLSNPAPLLHQGEEEHGIAFRLKIAKLADADPHNERMVLPITAQSEKACNDFLTRQGVMKSDLLIGFQPCASSRARMWPAEHFIALAKQLLSTYPGMRIVLTGSPFEASYCQGIADSIGNQAIVSAGKIPLRQLPALISRLDALVTGDTGTMHLAVAVNTPVVAMFAVSDSIRSGPAYDLEKHQIIQMPRLNRKIRSKSNDQSFMAQITTDEVSRRIQNILEQSNRG